MKKLLVFSIMALAACNAPQKEDESTMPSKDESFNAFKEKFVEALWKEYPGWATGSGYHKYDSILQIPNEQLRSNRLAFAGFYSDSLKRYKPEQLNDNNVTDYKLIDDFLTSIVWNISEFKSFKWDPSSYNISRDFAEIINNDYAPLDERLRSIAIKLKNVPAYYEAAKKSIENPTTEHTELAIAQNRGGTSVFTTDLKEAVAKSGLSNEEKSDISTLADEAVRQMEGFATWLEELENPNPRSFRIGKELYDKKFEYNIQSAYTAEEIYAKAVEHKEVLHRQMYGITKDIWSKYFGETAMPDDSLLAIRQLIDTISVKHVHPDSFQTAIEQQIPELVKFIEEKDLIYIDPSKPLVVRKEPAYMAGVAGASISSPGPYDKEGNTYYNVGSFGGWEADRIESYLREYNHYILQILNIHEAIPGHYTQLVYANQSPSIIKAILGNGAMVEGWAVYTERMMLENGYGNNQPEMWLMYYKWNMRSTCNTILDYSVHCKNMSKEEALDLLVNQAFQQQAEAEGKWRRVTLTQVQLTSYFTGFKEIYDFRGELMKDENFDLKEFHEEFLSYGSAPVKYIKELMLKKREMASSTGSSN